MARIATAGDVGGSTTASGEIGAPAPARNWEFSSVLKTEREKNEEAARNANALLRWLETAGVDVDWYLGLKPNQKAFLYERWSIEGGRTDAKATVETITRNPKIKPTAPAWTKDREILNRRGLTETYMKAEIAKGTIYRPAPQTTPAASAAPAGVGRAVGRAAAGVVGGGKAPTTPAEIKALQSELNAQGYTDDQGRPLVVDGKMGPRTRAALAKRQTATGRPEPALVAPAPAAGAGGGGGGGGGGGAVSGGAPGLAGGAPARPTDVTQFARENYGYLAYFLDDPEVGAVLRDAAARGLSKELMQGELYKTNWWKSQAEKTRNWLSLQSTDPATAAYQITNRADEIKTKSSQLGIGVSDERAKQIATDSLKYGWTDLDINQALAHEINFTGVVGGGVAGIMQGLRKTAGDYLVPLSDPALQDWTRQVVAGSQTEDSFRSYAVEQAKSLFPHLKSALDTGISVRQYVDPYVQMAARTLELNPAQVDLTDAKWMAPLVRIDPKTGDRTVMSLSEWDREMRTNKAYGYDNTQGAREERAKISQDLAQMFGMTG